MAWGTFVGWDRTVTAAPPMGCPLYVVADGTLLADFSGNWRDGHVAIAPLPPGEHVRIHSQLFHLTRYTFVADDGDVVAVRPYGGAMGCNS
jgi:hypothetical protein